jgi:acyl carrier protein
MTDQEIHDLVQRTLFAVAPEFEGEAIEPTSPFRDQFEIDSMDFLNFIIGLHEATKVDIPEADYPKLETLDGCIAYLKKKTQL